MDPAHPSRFITGDGRRHFPLGHNVAWWTNNTAIAGTFTLQFQNAPIKGAGSATVTCQLILKTTGEILLQYQAIGVSNACTVGVQDATANQGLQVAYNQSYLRIRISRP